MKCVPLFTLALAIWPLCSFGQVNQQAPVSASTPASDLTDESVLRSLLTATKPETVLRSGDVLTVKVYGVDTYAESQRVGDNGTIAFPLIGSTQVAGLTPEQLQRSVATSLSNKGMVMDAQVSVVLESRPSEIVSVLGDVVKPGTFPASGNLTIVDYLSQASGFVESAPGTQASSAASYSVTLVRPTLAAPVRIPLGPKPSDSRWGLIPLFPGDQIRVDKIGLVYAIGAFKAQGAFQLKNSNNTSITQLVALAGGVGYEADLNDAHIVRKEHGDTKVIPVQVAAILKGKIPDVDLQSEDILFVPTSRMKAAIKGGGPAIIVSLASAYLYAR